MAELPDHYRVIHVAESKGVYLKIERYIAIKETPKGYWVIHEQYKNMDFLIARYKKFVLKDSVRRFCYPSKEDALNNFYHRKRYQVQRLKYQLACAEECLKNTEIKAEDIVDYLLIGRPDIFDDFEWDY